MFPRFWNSGFHLAQAWQRKFRALGFQATYYEKNSEAAKWLKLCFGLPAMDEDDVYEFFRRSFEKEAPEELNIFINYLKKQYLAPNAKFPPKLWAGIGRLGIKYTSKGCESWHRTLSREFGNAKPNIYNFLERLNDVQVDINVKARSSKTVCDQNREYVRNLYKEMKEGHLSKREYLGLVASGFQPI